MADERPAKTRLREFLLDGYDKNIHPVPDHADKVKVKLDKFIKRTFFILKTLKALIESSKFYFKQVFFLCLTSKILIRIVLRTFIFHKKTLLRIMN